MIRLIFAIENNSVLCWRPSGCSSAWPSIRSAQVIWWVGAHLAKITLSALQMLHSFVNRWATLPRKPPSTQRLPSCVELVRCPDCDSSSCCAEKSLRRSSVRPRRHMAGFVMFHLARLLMTRDGCNVTDFRFATVCLLACFHSKTSQF